MYRGDETNMATMMNEEIHNIRRIELALIEKDQPTLCKATKRAKEYARTIKKKQLAKHWLQLIARMEKAMDCAANDDS